MSTCKGRVLSSDQCSSQSQKPRSGCRQVLTLRKCNLVGAEIARSPFGQGSHVGRMRFWPLVRKVCWPAGSLRALCGLFVGSVSDRHHPPNFCDLVCDLLCGLLAGSLRALYALRALCGLIAGSLADPDSEPLPRNFLRSLCGLPQTSGREQLQTLRGAYAEITKSLRTVTPKNSTSSVWPQPASIKLAVVPWSFLSSLTALVAW